MVVTDTAATAIVVASRKSRANEQRVLCKRLQQAPSTRQMRKRVVRNYLSLLNRFQGLSVDSYTYNYFISLSSFAEKDSIAMWHTVDLKLPAFPRLIRKFLRKWKTLSR